MKRKLMKRNGFTLIELIVVIAIIAILAAILVPKFGSFSDKAREASARQEANQLWTAISVYEAATGGDGTDSSKLSADALNNTITFHDTTYGSATVAGNSLSIIASTGAITYDAVDKNGVKLYDVTIDVTTGKITL